LKRDWPRYGTYAAGVLFCAAYAVLFFDPRGRAEMFPGFASMVLSLGLVVWDERRLPREAIADAFPEASRTLDVIATGPIAVVLHFLKTRWNTGKMRALAIAYAANVAFVAIDFVLSGEGDAGTLALSVLVPPLVLALVWRVFVFLRDRFDVERVLVLVGLAIVFASAAGIAVVLGSTLGAIALALVWIAASARAMRGP